MDTSMIARRRKAVTFRIVLDREKMKALRLQLDLTLEQAAKRAKFKSRQRWYQIEAGHIENITLDTLNAIAKALGVSAKDLLK
jgi:transcriptional regulator with XRE-family HTH domain